MHTPVPTFVKIGRAAGLQDSNYCVSRGVCSQRKEWPYKARASFLYWLLGRN
jgi:hypothetical protein